MDYPREPRIAFRGFASSLEGVRVVYPDGCAVGGEGCLDERGMSKLSRVGLRKSCGATENAVRGEGQKRILTRWMPVPATRRHGHRPRRGVSDGRPSR